jgi:hypothetical protein
MIMDATVRPHIRCLCSLPLKPNDPPEDWTAPFPVSLETAAYLAEQGYLVLVDPEDESDLLKPQK